MNPDEADEETILESQLNRANAYLLHYLQQYPAAKDATQKYWFQTYIQICDGYVKRYEAALAACRQKRQTTAPETPNTQ